MATPPPPLPGVSGGPGSSSGLPPMNPPPNAPPPSGSPPPLPPAGVGATAPKPATNILQMPKLLKATYLTEGETLLYERRPTRWLYLVEPTIILLLVLVLDFFLYLCIYDPSALGSLRSTFSFLEPSPGSAYASVLLIFAVLLLMVAVLYFGIRWLEYAKTVYVVTTTRLIRQKGILAKNFDEVQLTQVRGVLVKQGILNRILKFGTVRVSAEFGGITGNSVGNEDWPGVVHPMDFEAIVERAQERLRGVNPAPVAPRWGP